MADLSDVQNVLAGQIAAWLYPSGTGQESVVGFNVRVGCGWPTNASLDADLKSGIANVSVYATPNEQKTTRWQQGWQTQSSATPTLTLSQSGLTIVIGGANPLPYSQQNIAVFVNGSPYTYAVQPSDTLPTIAAALATVIAQSVPGTTSSGASVMLPQRSRIGPLRVGSTGTAVKVIRTQKRLFQIVLWCNTDAQRVALANCIDGPLSDLARLAMPDGLFARIVYHDSPQQDLGEKARLFRRDLRYMVEYSTTKTQTVAEVIVGTTSVTDGNGDTVTLHA